MANEEKLLKWMNEGIHIAEEAGYDGKFLAWMIYSAYSIEHGRNESFMSPGEFKAKMEEISKMSEGDKENSHLTADYLMGDILTFFGYEEGVKTFYNMPKWYS